MIIDLKRIKLYPQIGFLIFCMSCGQTNQDIPSGLIIDNSNPQEYSVEDLFQNSQLVKLNSFINKVDDLLELNNRLFILDRSMEFVKIFDLNGALLSTLQGDILQNGNSIQPVCLASTNDGSVFFYDAANQMFFFLDDDGQIIDNQSANFYCNRIYSYKDGYLIFKNQRIQNHEDSSYQYDVLVTNDLFEVQHKFFPFTIVQNIQRVWRYFPDPISVLEEGFDYYTPLTTYYSHVNEDDIIERIPLGFVKQGLTPSKLEGIDLDNPQQVLDNVLNKYALINNKRLVHGHTSGIRFIMNGATKFSFSHEDSINYTIDKLVMNYNDEQLLLPFPSMQGTGKWYCILDSENYNILNLPDYDNLHPIIDSVLAGDTYIVSIDLKP